MKTRRHWKAILSVLLAVFMILPSLAAIAETTEPTILGDLKSLTVNVWEDEEGNHVTYEVNESGETETAEAGVIYAANVESTDQMYPVDINAEGGTVHVTVERVEANWDPEQQTTPAVDISACEEADVTFISEDIVSDTEGIQIENTEGNVEAITGNIEAGTYGVFATNSEGTVNVTTRDITAGEEGVYAYTVDGTTAVKTGGITAQSVGVELYAVPEEYEWGNGLSGTDGQPDQENGNGGDSSKNTVNVTVDGDIIVKADGEGKDAYGISVENAYGEDTTVTFVVDGQISATSEESNAYGISVNPGEGAAVEGEVTGAVEANGDSAEAVNINTGENASVDIEIGGGVSATGGENALGINATTGGDDSSVKVLVLDDGVSATGEEAALGINATTEGAGSSVDITVKDGGVSATAEGTAYGIYANTNEADSSVTVTVQDSGDGAISAEGEMAFGISADNYDGEITINVTGNVQSSGTGIGIYDGEQFQADPENPYEGEIIPGEYDVPWGDNLWRTEIDGKTVFYCLDEEGNVTAAYNAMNVREGGDTSIAVIGDVVAEDTAVQVSLTEAQSTIDITVDGEIEGKKHAIVLSEETIAENLTLTVWKVTPNEDGNIAERVEYTEDDEGKFTENYKADRDTEKLIQYIIRIEENSSPYIATSGTTDYRAANGTRYQVAHEGDKVLVKLNIPNDKELVGAYWDQAQSEAGRLLVDFEGNYYVEVPRGGGVELSLVMKDIPKPEPAPVPVPEHTAVSTVITVRDLENRVSIKFYRSGKFVVLLDDGREERGTYEFSGNQLVLNAVSGRITVDADATFTYHCDLNARSYQFKLSRGNFRALKNLLALS